MQKFLLAAMCAVAVIFTAPVCAQQTITGAWSKASGLPDTFGRMANFNMAVGEAQAEHGTLTSPYRIDQSTTYNGPVTYSTSTNVGNLQNVTAVDGSTVQFTGSQTGNNMKQGANASGYAGSGSSTMSQSNKQ